MKVPPCSPGCQQHSELWSFYRAFGPWATRSALFCSAGCIGPAVKCDQSAPLGPGLGAEAEQMAQSAAERARCLVECSRAASLWYRGLVHKVLLAQLEL